MATCSDVSPSFNDVFKEVYSVLDWYALGLHLGVPRERLNIIEHDCRELAKKQGDMLDYWLKNSETQPTWTELGEALLKIENYRWLGKQILQKYCLYGVNEPTTSPRTSHEPPSIYTHEHPSIPKHLLPCPHHLSSPPRPISSHQHHNPHNMIPGGGGRPTSGDMSSLYNGGGSQVTPPFLHQYPSSMTTHPYPNPYQSPTPTPPSLPPPTSYSTHSTVADHRHSIQHGEMFVDASNLSLASYPAHSINDPNSSVGGTPRLIVAYDRNSHQWQPSSSHLLNFLRFDPSPNNIQSPVSCISSNRSQVVPNTSSLTASQEQLAEKELVCCFLDFKDLMIQARKALIKVKVQGEKIKKYLHELFRGTDCFGNLKTLKAELSKIPDNATVDQVFEVLLEFLSYDCPRVLTLLIKNFLPKSDLVNAVTKYESNFRNFQSWCSMGNVADVHPTVYPPENHHYSDTTVAMHLNDNWQQQTYRELDALKDREFGHCNPHMSFRMVHAERRSVVVVWETSYAIVNELSVRCVERFAHLVSQGVLQLLIGRNLLDYTFGRKPKLYELKVTRVIERNKIHASPSMMSLMTVGTQDTRWSGETGGVSQTTTDSGHYSCDTASSSSSRARCAPSTLPPITDRLLQKCPLKEVQIGYENSSKELNLLNVMKGEKVRVMYETDEWAEVVNSHKQHGYIPSYVFMETARASIYSSSQSIIDLTDTAPSYNVELYEVSNESHDQSHDQICDVVSSQPSPTSAQEPALVRPDTPPLVWQMDAYNVHLSDDKNTMMDYHESLLESSNEVTTQHVEKRNLKNFMKEIETLSLTKSQRSELNRVKKENDVPKTISFFQKLKKLVQPQRKISTTSITASEVDLSPLDNQHDWYTDLPNVLNSDPRLV